MGDVAADHRMASDGFLDVAAQVTDWSAPTPCTDWDAQAVLEHVVGFHQVLILDPLDRKVDLAEDDRVDRWRQVADAVHDVLSNGILLERQVEVPGMRSSTIGRLGPILTTDVLVHTWDLAASAGAGAVLDPDLVAIAYERAAANADALEASGMFAERIEVAGDAAIQDRLLGLMGRDPAWAGTA